MDGTATDGPVGVPRCLVDGHLDLAHNAVVKGRDLLIPLDQLRDLEHRTSETALVTLPELRQGGIGVVLATLFASPAVRLAMQPVRDGATQPPTVDPDGYRNSDEAHAQALEQLLYYEDLERMGQITIIGDAPSLSAHLDEYAADPQTSRLGVVLLMEGADPIRHPDEVEWWWERGLRILGLSWQRTRYAGGTAAPGPVTPLGHELLRHMRRQGMALDVSHLSVDALDDALDGFDGPTIASHVNAKALTPTDRHLDERALREIGRRGGVVGVALANVFLDQDAYTNGRPVRLRSVGEHMRVIAASAGWDAVAIGSDIDGGFGLEETPLEIRRGSDLHLISEVVPPQHSAGVLGENWLRWLLANLPSERHHPARR